MDVLTKKIIKRMSAALFIAFLCVAVYGYAAVFHAVDATLVAWGTKGTTLWGYVREEFEHEGREMRQGKDITANNFSNSTDFINALYEMRGIPGVPADSNIWAVVKSLPADAPDDFIVMCTRNIDPKSLKLRLAEEGMEGRIRFSDPADCRLGAYGILIRKDGRRVRVKHTKLFPSRHLSYRHVYQNKEFDLLPGKGGRRAVSFLTPTGEVNVEE